MATYEDKIKAVGTKLAMLKFTDSETESVIAKGHLLSLGRQRKMLEKKLEEVQFSRNCSKRRFALMSMVSFSTQKVMKERKSF